MNIILSPHLDDAVLSLGGLLATEGDDTLVATFFAGSPATPLSSPWDIKCGFTNSDGAIRTRIDENKKSLGMFGVTDDRIRNYAHLDAEYRRDGSDPKVLEQELEGSISAEINSLLKEFASNSLKIFIPGFELHMDHFLVKRAALAVAKTLPSERAPQFFFYQDIPYAFKILGKEYRHPLWNIFTSKDPRSWDYSLLENEITHKSFSVSAHIVSLTQSDMKKKLSGVMHYTSQIARLGEQFLDRLEQFSSAQSQFFSLPAPYCEVVYTLVRSTA